MLMGNVTPIGIPALSIAGFIAIPFLLYGKGEYPSGLDPLKKLI
jgi:hypothetical protein